ncbi:methyltransferase [Halobacteriales archaeon QH_7_66_37]|nr:MAG: methyltransferase [Halobacteriales archaeon QH_7_66_37]
MTADDRATGRRADDDGNRDDGRPRLADLRDIETVYQPAEDSRLLADAVVDHVSPDDRVLDVGTGSGYVGVRVQSEAGAFVVGSDLNPDACRQAASNGLTVVRGDMVEPFRDGSFDVVCCNPPYLPTPPEQEWDDPMERALSGGPEGRAVVDPFLASVGRVLKPGGEAFLLISTLTGPDEVRDTAADNGLQSSVVAEESHPFERLLVLQLRPH